LDSIVSNEVGDPADLIRPEDLAGSSSGGSKQPRRLNLRYDLTPIKFVGMVVTEVGMIPPTAVPALIREYRWVCLSVIKSVFSSPPLYLYIYIYTYTKTKTFEGSRHPLSLSPPTKHKKKKKTSNWLHMC
jgi:hypothetical protein